MLYHDVRRNSQAQLKLDEFPHSTLTRPRKGYMLRRTLP